MGIPDQYMKYLTFGLSTLAKPAATKRPISRRLSTSSDNTIKPTSQTKTGKRNEPKEAGSKSGALDLTQMDPIPDGEPHHAKIARQRYFENKGHFVIGSTGDLEDIQSEDGSNGDGVDSGDDGEGGRILIRTVYLELTPERVKSEHQRAKVEDGSVIEGLDALDTTDFSPPTSGNNVTMNYRRFRVVIYARRPFIYCFLFQNRIPSLQMAGFYKGLHKSLMPIHKPMVASTSPARLAERIANARASASSQFMDSNSLHQSSLDETAPIYDLIYDPQRLTIHTSIPNIPEPGTPAAEGLSLTSSSRSGSSTTNKSTLTSSWTRIEALNVHSQVLNTLTATSLASSTLPSGIVRHDLERTSKTSRGWWIVWLRLPPSEEDSSVEQHPTRLHSSNANNNKTSSFNFSASSSLPGPPSTTSPSHHAPPPSTDRIAILVRNGNLLPPPPSSTAPNPSFSSLPSSTSALQQQLQNQQQQQQQQQTSSQDGLSRAAASMWSALSLRSSPSTGSGGVVGGASFGTGGGNYDGRGGAGAAAAAGALGGGIGVDARGYVEGVLGGLNR
jgi:hypothetical protein